MVLVARKLVLAFVLSLHHHGNALTVSWARGAGVTLGMTVAGGVSGGHLNPALTIAVASLGKFPWAKVRLTVSWSAVTPPRPGRCLTTWRRSTWAL